ncbi:MAG: substrate-binding domain-containing protein [Chitinophagaceae bacterium]|nr:substrate-binding domain-containing protein [Chitinophagaceae bacterium]
MRKITSAAIYILMGIAIICQFSCNTQTSRKYRIGISQLGEGDEWRKDMKEELYRELVFYPNIEAIYRQADYSSDKQVEQIKELMQQDIDLLIVCPYEAAPLTPVVEEAYNKGIKVVIVDRNINSELYNSYIGADNFQVGQFAGVYAARYLNNKGNIIEITGLQTSTPAREREKGFAEAIKKFPGISIQKVISGDWLEGSVENQLPAYISELKNTQLIFAHNDVMARTAAAICKKAGLSHIKILGVDALPGTGLSLVENHTLLASVLYPTGGSEAIRIADKLLRNENVPRRNILETIVVDSTNAIMLLQQANKITEQQKNIVRQQQLLAQQTKTFKTQRNLIFILVGSLVLSLMLAGLLVYSRGKNIKVNKKLHEQNEEISEQSRQIVLMADKAREANEEKLNFFTNISHELKTPLTLILAPTEEALRGKLSVTTRNQFSLVKKNATRLLLLVNQLMDFRKLELNKMKLELHETDLVQFLQEIVNAFAVFAKQHHVDCRIITKETTLPVWIDCEKIEKVFFNILSNAFKFTGDNGFIHLTIHKDALKGEAVINVQDSGIGMGKEEQGHLFEMFYQAGYDSNKGTGLGLALSKALIELHKGNIAVQSERDKGSVFTIYLKLGNTHFSEEQIHPGKETYNSQVSAWIENYYVPGTKQLLPIPEEEMPVKSSEEKETVLIVEDHNDLREFLSQRLSAEYNVITANDGAEGIKKLFDEMPDVVISDVMMPKTDGIALTKSLKDDIRTRHIPVILLTAKTTEENKLQGISANADAYITKPFNVDILEGTISSLLENRIKLKEHYSAEIPSGINGGIAKKSDRSFTVHLNAIIEQNIPNENFSVDDICREMHISRVQLYRKVKLLFDTSVNDHILLMRIQRARHYLQNEDIPIAEIATRTGFATASYFSTAFKKFVNESPKEYRSRFR